MTEDELERVFKMRLQLRDPQAGADYGTSGIGLSISQAIVDALGGHLTVTSVVGQGTTFAFDVPCTRQAVTATTMTPPITPSTPQPKRLFRVLVEGTAPSTRP